MATHLAGVWINRVRLPVLHVVSWTGKMNISLAAFVPENLVSRDRNLQTPAFINVYISWHAANLRFFTSMTCRDCPRNTNTKPYWSTRYLLFGLFLARS